MNRTCPKCVPDKRGYPYQHIHQMKERLIHASYHLKDEQGLLIPWTEENLPKIYICPDCGYTEWYQGLGETENKDGEGEDDTTS